MSATPQFTTIARLLGEIDDFVLPAIQREFVWPTEKIEDLFDSILRGYPIGTLLLWDVREPEIHDFTFYKLVRDYDERMTHNEKVSLLNKTRCKGILDGQQRITSLALGMLGSYTEKTKWKRRTTPDAYPAKRLYIDLLYVPNEDAERRFHVKFLARERAKSSDDREYWLPIGEALKLSNEDKLVEFRRATPYGDNLVFEKTLNRLQKAVHTDSAISYFTCDERELDEVLNIFVRLNMGGEPLSYSDLLLSLATAAWKGRDAREDVYKLVDDLNTGYGKRFWFTKDFVLKALLVASGGDARFKAANIRKQAGLEQIWIEVADSIRRAVALVARFGFDGSTLRATNALIPISYFIRQAKRDDGFLTQSVYMDEREVIRLWLLKSMLSGVFGGQADRTLTDIRGVIDHAVNEKGSRATFPAEEISRKVRERARQVYEREDVEQIVDKTQYGSAEAFMVLALICPHLDFQYSTFDIDHMHPKSSFTKRELLAGGVPESDVEFCLAHFNFLPNLQLLAGPVNEAKKRKPFVDWLAEQPNANWHRETSFVPKVNLSLSNFREFYDKRRSLLVEALMERLGMPSPNKK